MANNTEYKFTVLFDSQNSDVFYSLKKIRYAGDREGDDENRDSIIIQKNKIEIICNRSTDKSLDTNDKIYNSQLYFHLLRSLIFYYAYEMTNTKIISIKLEKKRKDRISEQEWNSDLVRNLFFNVSDCKKKIDIKKYFETFKIFDLKRKTDFYSDIIMYYLQGCSEQEKNPKTAFEYYWRALNCLYENKISGKNEKKKLQELKNYCEEQDLHNTFTNTKKFITQNLERIKNELDWKRYFKYKIFFDDGEYKDLVFDNKIEFHNSDFLTFFKDRFISENIECNNKDKLLKRIDEELNKPSEKQSEIDYITFIVTRYMYYLRCSNFHAAINYERTALFNVNYFDNEFKLVNEIISVYLLELINSLDSSFFYIKEKPKKERKMEDLKCPNCGRIMAKDLSIKEGSRSTSFEKCIRRCNDCKIGYSNSKDKPTLIYKDYLKSIPEKYKLYLEYTIDNSINTGHLKSKKNQFGFSTSEDALTWIFIRYFINEKKLDVLKKLYSLKSEIEEILLWGVSQINKDDNSEREKLESICESLKELQTSYSEPDIIIITKTEVRFIEVKLGAKNQKKDSPNKYNKYICNDFYSDKDLLIKSKHYELARNWTIGNMFTESKDFKLINQGPSKLFYNDDKELLQKFENSLNDSDRFEKLSWEKIIDTITPSVTNDFLEELNRRLKFVL